MKPEITKSRTFQLADLLLLVLIVIPPLAIWQQAYHSNVSYSTLIAFLLAPMFYVLMLSFSRLGRFFRSKLLSDSSIVISFIKTGMVLGTAYGVTGLAPIVIVEFSDWYDYGDWRIGYLIETIYVLLLLLVVGCTTGGLTGLFVSHRKGIKATALSDLS